MHTHTHIYIYKYLKLYDYFVTFLILGAIEMNHHFRGLLPFRGEVQTRS